MTTKKLFAPPRNSRSARRWELHRNATVATAFLGLALATLLASSAAHRPAVAAAPEPVLAGNSSNPDAAPPPQPDQVRPRAETVRASEVETVAGIVARRYRVSREATRGLVEAAYRAGVRSGVDPLLIVAVIAVESRFNPIAQSDGGAMGLMQIIPHYHADKLDPKAGSVLDPETNIRVGVTVLKDYIKRGGTEIAGLQLYNGSFGDPDNSYAQRVLAEKQRLQAAVSRERPHNRV